MSNVTTTVLKNPQSLKKLCIGIIERQAASWKTQVPQYYQDLIEEEKIKDQNDQAHIVIEYVYLSVEERNRFATGWFELIM